MQGSTTAETERELWRRFKETGDPELRNRLVVHYSPLVKFVSGRVRSGLPSTVEQDDLISDGVIGLMDANDKFEPERGLQFQTYAVTRIRGAMVDGLRASDWVPRTARDKIRRIETTTEELALELGRPPTDEELSAALDLTVETLRKHRGDGSHSGVSSLEESLDNGHAHPVTSLDLPDAEDDLPEEFLSAVRTLPERDRVVVALYYWERFTLAEIGRVLGVTESRVSQLMSRATRTLRSRLGVT